MIPSTTAAVVGFLFFVAPGLVWELQQERQRPPRDGSTFREVSRVALASVIFTSSATVLLAGLRALFGVLLDPGAWLRTGDHYLQREYRIIAVTAVAEVSLACGLAYATSRPWRTATQRPEGVLWILLNTTVTGTRRRVSVRLDDGMVYTGNFSRLDDGPRDEGFLELQPPLVGTKGGGEAREVEFYQRLAVPLANVRDVFVEWKRLPADESPGALPDGPAPTT